MTLAVIFLLIILGAASAPSAAPTTRRQAASQSAPAEKPADAAQTQEQSSAPPTPNPPTASKPADSEPASARKSPDKNQPKASRSRWHKKKAAPSSCNTTPPSAPPDASTPTTAAPADANAGSTTSSGASTNCPPSKVIVRQGGATEPSIQLAGSTNGNQASIQRETANQMLDSTQENLKKIAGRQLTSSQQDMVNQIQQFVKQSKDAVTAGNFDRARTLAWKAQLLSEELAKPEQ